MLEGCESDRFAGFTSVTAVAEAAHRLMMIEAVTKGLVSPGNVVRKLRDKPALVRELHVYQEQIELIPLMGIAVRGLDLEVMAFAAEIRAAPWPPCQRFPAFRYRNPGRNRGLRFGRLRFRTGRGTPALPS